MQFFEELRRRKIVQVALAYLVAAWGIAQVAELVLDAYEAPSWIMRAVLALMAVGFPLAIGLFWALDLPWSSSRQVQTDVTENRHPRTPAGSIKFDSIVVLPFANMSSDPDQEFFSDGIAEELLNLLTKIPELRVISRVSAFSYKDKDVKVGQIADELDVAYLLEGSVRRSENEVRIAAQLIDARSDTHLWSETYHRALGNIFAIQDEIAGKVVAQLKCTLLGEAPAVRQTNPKAYTLGLQAQHLCRQGTVEAWEKAILLYREALGIESSYAPAWAGLAQVYLVQAFSGVGSPDECSERAREAAKKALALDARYAPAHDSMGLIASTVDHDLATAARHYGRALELEPGNSDILVNAAILARSLTRTDQAIALLEYAVERDPLNPTTHNYLGINYGNAGRLDEAIESFRTSLTLSPGHLGVQADLGDVLLQKGEPEAALEAIRQDASIRRAIYLPMAYHALGRQEESDAALEKLVEKHARQAAYNIAYVMAYRGEVDKAFEWLGKAIKFNDPGLTNIAIEPHFQNIRRDPRWIAHLKSIGKSPEQLAAIEFNVPRPIQR